MIVKVKASIFVSDLFLHPPGTLTNSSISTQGQHHGSYSWKSRDLCEQIVIGGKTKIDIRLAHIMKIVVCGVLLLNCGKYLVPYKENSKISCVFHPNCYMPIFLVATNSCSNYEKLLISIEINASTLNRYEVCKMLGGYKNLDVIL
jgi:hypothetical protein